MSRRTGPVAVPSGCGRHDHLSWPYLGSESWRGAVTTFLREGQERGERLLYLAAGTGDGPLDLDGVTELRAGALNRLEIIERLVDDAVAGGHTGVRIAVDTTSLVGRDFARYELVADGLIARAPLVVMCGYDLSSVAPDLAALLDFVHPLRRPRGCAGGDGAYPDGAGGWWMTGVLDLCNADHLQLALSTMPPTGEVRIDVSQLRFCDAAATRVLLRAASRRHPAGRLVLCGASPLLRRVLEVGWPGGHPGLVLR
ncbi:MEDS domain-containing protein [Virgisporangium aliadipatigenens]|uniref:MEDS domain-containing protein n=1 Tax=Virgisporangium aliadipatigenens TaxID=741659 RepID=UPI00194157DA|nr:MEDS domain-containing protein [Virgisporangium aliadipatigenens]